MDLAVSVPGVDLSHYDDANGARPIAYDTLVSSARWVVLKAGENVTADPSFARHVLGVDGRIFLGTYWFCRPGRDPVAEALAWARTVHQAEAAGATFAMGHWADLEDDDGLEATAVTAWLRAFLAAADAELGRPVGLYVGDSWWRGNVQGFDPGERLWWVARYRWQTQNGSPIGPPPPANPADWPAFVYARVTPADLPVGPAGHDVSIWQWSSIGVGPGVGTFRPTSLDCDLMAAPVFAALTGAVHDAGRPAPPPAPAGPTSQEDDMAPAAKLVQVEGDPRVYITDGIVKRWVADEADDLNPLAAVGLVADRPAPDQPIPIASVSQSFLDRLETVGSPPS